MRSLDPGNVYFIQSYWADAARMRSAAENIHLDTIREQVVPLLEERIAAWEMQIVQDSARMPVFRARGA